MRWLLAAANDPQALAAAFASGAEAVVIDLPAAAPERDAARAQAACAASQPAERRDAPAVIVRVHPLASGETDRDLDAVMPAAPFAIMLPETRGAASLQQLSAKIGLREALNGIDDGATAIVAAIDTAEGLLAAASLRGATARLIALVFDPARLAAEVDLDARRDGADYASPLQTARDMVLFAAAAAGVSAVAATAERLEDATVRSAAEAARGAGFVALIAETPGPAHPASPPQD